MEPRNCQPDSKEAAEEIPRQREENLCMVSSKGRKTLPAGMAAA